MRIIAPLLLSALLIGCAKLPNASSNPEQNDASFNHLADEYIQGYLAWRPQSGTLLGLHQYDGKLTDYSQPSLDAELARLKSFEHQLSALSTEHLTSGPLYDYRILRSAIQREIFS